MAATPTTLVGDVQPFRLGDDVRVVPAACTIAVGDAERRVDFKAMQVLLTLVASFDDARADEPAAIDGGARATITKEAIMARVWPDTAVTDDVLTGAISNLRKALGDDARAPRFIQTVPRVGYRLIAPPTAATDATTASAAPGSGSRGRHASWLLLALTVVILLLVAWRLRTGGPSPAPETLGVAATNAPSAPIRSLAVLPLAAITSRETDRYLADGMTEALITELARLPDLKVISRTSVMRYRDTERSLLDIGRELDVDVLVEGSIQREGDTLRVSAQLIDAATDHHLWADRFDGLARDVLGLQARLAAAITARIRAVVSPLSVRAVPIAPAAYESYLQGRYWVARRGAENLSRAAAAFREVTVAEPSFAPAWVALAEASIELARERALLTQVGFADARAALDRAFALGDPSARALALRAHVAHQFEWDFTTAEADYRAAIALDASDGLARRGYAQLLSALGRFDEALVHIRRLREVDPLAYSRPDVAALLTSARRLPEALDELTQQLAVEPTNPMLHLQRALVLGYAGQPRACIDAYQQYLTHRGDDREALARVDAAFAERGLTGVYQRVAAEFEALADQGLPISSTDRARAHAGGGALDAALDALDRARVEREADLLTIAHDPAFDPLRGHPRFERLVSVLGLTRQ